MDAFSPIPNHAGFTARPLFAEAQGILKKGAFAKMEPGGGGPLSPHRHAVWNRSPEPAEIVGLALEASCTPPIPSNQ